jgi:hypothetical protein
MVAGRSGGTECPLKDALLAKNEQLVRQTMEGCQVSKIYSGRVEWSGEGWGRVGWSGVCWGVMGWGGVGGVG